MTAPKVVAAIIVIVPLLLNQPAQAGIRPSFELDGSTWNATDIVVVAITGVDGRFNVLESLKGDLRAGDIVFVPELVPPLDGAPIRLFEHDWPKYYGERVPRQPVGSRMVLFLKQLQSASNSAGGSAERHWGATDWGETSIKASVVWFDGDALYNFCQPINPGPSVLCPWAYYFDKSREPRRQPMTEAVLKTRIAKVIQTQQDFNETLSLQDSAERASRLLPLVHSDVYTARREALNELQKCGKAALPSMHAALDDVAFEEQWAQLVKIYADVGGAAVLSDLTAYLEREADYWAASGPSVPDAWITQIERPPYWHYSTTAELMTRLRTSSAGFSHVAINRVCRVWHLVPAAGSGGTNRITEECKKRTNE